MILFGVFGCQQLIGLGDEPELSSETAEGPREYKCGIPPPSGPNCRSCLDEECCEQQIACSKDSVCSESLNCMQLCYELSCVNTCLDNANNEALTVFFACNLQRCASACTLQGDCLRMATNCCGNVDETVRSGCMNVAQGEDQAICLEAIESLGDACDE